jgi:hypothetical protein
MLINKVNQDGKCDFLHWNLLGKEIKNKNKCKNNMYSWTGRLYIAQIYPLPKSIYKFNITPISPLTVFTEIKIKNPKSTPKS